ncbi:hypothetical protein [Halomonas sp. PR-M31]|nr:hypothetical protein [Halomonas sp. PR-M31]
MALYGFIVFYVICVALTWFYYTRGKAEISFDETPMAATAS